MWDLRRKSALLSVEADRHGKEWQQPPGSEGSRGGSAVWRMVGTLLVILSLSSFSTGNESSSPGKKRLKTSVKKAEPKANGHQDGLAHCPEPQGTDPPPIRKSLVTFLRGKSEEIYADTVQMQAQQHGSLLTHEQLSQLRQLSDSLTAMVHTFYSMANQAGFGFPAEGWLVPDPMLAPQELAGKESRSPSLEGGEKTTDLASPSDKS